MFRLSNKYDLDRRTLHVGSLTLWWPFPVVACVHSSAAIVLGWPVYGGDCPKPLKWLYRMFEKISDAKYWIFYRLVPKHQYHIVRTGLPPNYHCEYKLILYACMAMLCRYVDSLGGETEIEAFNRELRDAKDDAPEMEEINRRQIEHHEEALAIYRWWKNDKPADEAREHELVTKLYADEDRVTFVRSEKQKFGRMVFKEFEGEEIELEEELRALQDKISEDEQQMLHRLIDIRQSLWT